MTKNTNPLTKMKKIQTTTFSFDAGLGSFYLVALFVWLAIAIFFLFLFFSFRFVSFRFFSFLFFFFSSFFFDLALFSCLVC